MLFESENLADANKFAFRFFVILTKHKAYPQFRKAFDSQGIH